MKKHIRFAVKSILFVGILAVLVNLTNKILTPKYYMDSLWPTTSTYEGFYDMEENTVDVLFLGSSHAASCFNPQVMYNAFGIQSYNLACEHQNLLTSYYWLMEALRFQTPKVVILDTYTLFTVNKYEPLNTAENCTRKAFDNMKWSKIKWEAVHDICNYDEKQTLSSYYFPNVRYHTRWAELQEEDFRFSSDKKHYELKGYTPLDRKGGYAIFEPFREGDTTDCSKMVPLMEQYLNRIAEVCREKNIELVLVKTPAAAHNISKYNAIKKYADENGVEYWDFNEAKLYNDCEIVFSEDLHDDMHVNIWGSEKISVYIADKLCREFDIGQGKGSEQWAQSNEYYQDVLSDCELKYISDVCEYLAAIKKDRYTILVSVLGDGTDFMTDDVRTAFMALHSDIMMQYEQRGSYYLVVHEGSSHEAASMDKLSYLGSTCNNLVDYEIISGGGEKGGYVCSIKVNGEECATARQGINIVVYSNENMKVVDSVCYNGEIVR